MAATKITTDDKSSGDLFLATEYNEIKEVVNGNADELDTKQRGTAYSDATLVSASAFELCTVTCANNVGFGLIIKYSITAIATTTYQTITGQSIISGYNTGSVIATDHDETEVAKISTGTFTAAITIVDNTDDTFTVKITPETSLSEANPVIKIHWLIENLSSQTIAPNI